jgi:hypothetical protein
MARNPCIEKLVQNAVQRCRERLVSSRKSTGTLRNGPQSMEESGITSHRKQSHGL